MSSLIADLRFAGRVLRGNPTLTVTVLMTLALGIGANTAVFGLVHGVLLDPLPFADADELHVLRHESPRGEWFWFAAPNYRDLSERSRAFSGIAAFNPDTVIVGGGEEPERVGAAEVTTDFFDVLGLEPRLGRAFGPDDHAEAVVVVGHGFWQRQLGGDPGVIGADLRIEGAMHRIVGVAPPGRLLPLDAELWTPIDLDAPEWRTSRGTIWLLTVGRLAPGAEPAAARAELERLGAALAEEFPDTNADVGFGMTPLYEYLVGSARPPLAVMMAGVVLVLLITCANVAGLLIGWARQRRREVAIRMALGGSRGQIVRQFLVESLLLAAGGGALGVAFAHYGSRFLMTIVPADTPRIEQAGIDPPTLLFCAAVTILSGIAFGLLPALRASQSERRADGRQGLGGSTSSTRTRAHAFLVVAQVALAVVLSVAAGLLSRSAWGLAAVDPGFDTEGIATVGLPLVERDFESRVARTAHLTGIQERVRTLPGVASAALISVLPIRDSGPTFSFELRQTALPEDELLAGFRVASAGYFETIGIPVVVGRPFLPSEDRESEPVAIVDETFAERFFPDGPALGQEIELLGDWRRIVGVVAAVRDVGLDRSPSPRMFVPLSQSLSTRQRMVLVARATEGVEAKSLRPAILRATRELHPRQAFSLPMTMREMIDRSLAPARFPALALSAFGAVALLLAAVGLYGLLAYTVGRRRREIGIRMAVGASGAEVRRMVLGRAFGLTALGLAVGLAGALATGRLVESLLVEVTPRDPATFALVVAVLASVAVLAAWLPARRASRVDAVRALRER